ncbi:MAG: hypothetical protein QOK43_2309 [Acidimicrobiaceae bacterium]|nr:hypothetical protein [Acidimicrobiaceae bacterium]
MGESSVEWSVDIDLGIDTSQRKERVAEAAEDLLDLLADTDADAAAVVSVGGSSVGVRLSVRSKSAAAAVKAAVTRVERAAAEAGLHHSGARRVEAATAEWLDAALAEPSMPVLVGTSEVAALLGVTRQRVSELARAGHFPSPLAILASGPVWMETAIARFVESWDRAPGRRPIADRAKTPAAERIAPKSVARVRPKHRTST